MTREELVARLAAIRDTAAELDNVYVCGELDALIAELEAQP